MGIDNVGGPSEAEKARFLKKIQEWKELGFETDDLEDLLENDFNQFLRRRHQILKAQLPKKIGVPKESPVEPDTEGEVFPVAEEPPQDMEPPVAELDTISADEDLLLVGEPLPPESEVMEEVEEEGLIEVSKPKRIPKSKVHRSREEKLEKETTPKRPPPEPEDEELEEDDKEEAIEEELEEEEEEEEFEEEEEEEVRRVRPRGRPPRGEKPPGSPFGMVAKGFVLIIVILLILYVILYQPISFDGGDGNGNGGGNGGGGAVTAAFEITAVDGYYHGALIEFDASNSTGEIQNYQWTIDEDFKVLDGDRKSERLKGYFTATENTVKTETIRLRVSNKNNEDFAEEDIKLQPQSFTITEERTPEEGKYRVNGFLEISNPDGIYTIDVADGKLIVKEIHIDFQTTNQPMEMMLESVNNVEDGFRQSHQVYKRTINQYLILSGTIKVVPEIPQVPSVPIDVELNGTMDSTDNSYIDYTTGNTIHGEATNNIDITIKPVSIIGKTVFEGTTMTSKDIIESYPDLRQNPMRFKLTDLSRDKLEIGDQSGITVGKTVYVWHAQKVEYIFNNPAIKVNLTMDYYTMNDSNLADFFSAFWIAEGISQPVKTHIHTVSKDEGTTTILNYISEMVKFTPGVTKISSQSCDTITSTGDHFFKRAPGQTYVSSSNWTYLPPTGNGSENSFNDFTQEQALNFAQTNQDFINYTRDHPGCYVVTGHCNATEEVGELTWNLTLGTKGLKNGLNLIITSDGSVISALIEIDSPPNSTSDFEPLLTFESSEDIFSNFTDKDFHEVIFSNGKIDFENVKYGVETNLPYPNVDITSINLIEYSKYCYYVSYREEIAGEEESGSVALDAETGQLLFYWKHTGSGFDLFQFI